MSFRNLDPHSLDEPGLSTLMKQHGLMFLVVELGLLAVLTIAAISTDDFWSSRAAK